MTRHGLTAFHLATLWSRAATFFMPMILWRRHQSINSAMADLLTSTDGSSKTPICRRTILGVASCSPPICGRI